MPDPFSDAIAHHKAGQLDLAADLYLRILAENPLHADCLNLLGVIAHQKGNGWQAVDLIGRAIQINARVPAYHVNLATAYRALGRHDEAIQSCGNALDLQPELTEARLSLGLSLQALKHLAEAEEQFRWLSDNRPSDSRGPQTLANCLREQGRTAEAISSYREALARNPNDGAANLGLGTILLMERNPRAAEPHLRRATELAPTVISGWLNFGACLVKLGREREAVPVFEQGLRLAPNDLELGVNLGQAFLGCGDMRAAENCFNEVLRFQADFPAAVSGLADIHRIADRAEEALPLYERVLRLNPAGDAYKGLAECLWDSGEVERGVTVLREGIASHPADADNHIRLAAMLAAGGDLEGAEKSCRAALEIQPGQPLALVQLAQTRRSKLTGEEQRLLEKSLQEPIPDIWRSTIHFGIAQLADAQGDYSKAAEHLRLANAQKKAYHEARRQVYDPGDYSRYIDRLIETFDAAFFAKVKGFGVPDERPVFVVGMPRSGTTLIEQILASHPQVFGAGERRFAHLSLDRMAQELGNPDQPLQCIGRLTAETAHHCAEWHLEQLRQLDGGRAARVVDKMPDNYALLGWLAVTLPKARFIHCRRDVRDIALSCWMTNFVNIMWANDLGHIAERIRDYQRIMAHWRKVLPAPILEIDYEKLVADQERESKKMVKWLGLKWDPACLEFHRSSRLVKTASVAQVRQPVYTRSAGRWKHYQDTLSPFLKGMGMK